MKLSCSREPCPCVDGRQGDDGAQAPSVIDELDVAAMVAHDAAGDGEAEADAARFALAGILEPVERHEDLLGELGRDAGSVILDHDVDRVLSLGDRYPRTLAIAHRILDQVADGAPERIGAAAIFDLESVAEGDVMAHI